MGSSKSKVSDVSHNNSPRKSGMYDSNFNGPVKNRSCTDVLCLLLFILFLFCWAAASFYGFANGDPERLVYPSNSKGEICGQGEYSNKKYLLFFDLSRCLTESVLISGCPTPQVCVEECPKTFGRPYHEDGLTENEKKKMMQPYCSSKELTEEMMSDNGVTADTLIESKICPPWWLPSRAILKRCLPSFVELDTGEKVQNESVLVTSSHTMNVYEGGVTAGIVKAGIDNILKLLNLRSFGERVFSDLKETWWMVIIGLIFATMLALLWIILMRYVAKIMVWSSIFIVLGLIIVSCCYCIYKYINLRGTDDTDQPSWFSDGFEHDIGTYASLSSTWLFLFFLSLIVLVILAAILIFLRKRIKIAIELIEEGSLAVGDMKSILLFPVIPFCMELIFIGWYILVAVYLGSSGEQQFMVNEDSCITPDFKFFFREKTGVPCRMTPDGPMPPENVTSTCPDATCEFFRYGNTDIANYLQLLNLFGLLWSLFFLSAMEEMIMAGAFATWYFTMNKKNLPLVPVTQSFYRTFRYHLGTLAFGSLIISAIRFIRMIIEYIERKLKEYSEDNFCVKCIFCCCRCCCWCLESFMKFINRNAYIVTAIYGDNFCSAARQAFSLLMRNMARVFVLDQIADFLLLLGKLVVVGTVGLLSFYIFSGRIGVEVGGDLHYYFVPVFLITIGTYFIADVFFGVYEMAVDTLFLCFLEDLERNDGTPEKPYFMSKDLMKILGKTENKEASD